MKKNFSKARLAPVVLVVICLLALLTIMITACTTGSTDTGPNPVYMGDSNFYQSSITIKKGQSLTLVSDSPSVHIIENGTWDSNGTPKPNRENGAPLVDSEIDGGNSQTFGPFNTAGTFQLYCTVHTGMNLTVIVK